jgi:hypothetical protein
MTIDISEKLAFLDNSWLISISKIPRYNEFKELFTQPLDYHLCKLLLDVKHEKITDLMKQEFEDKVMKSMNKNTGIVMRKYRVRTTLVRTRRVRFLGTSPPNRVLRYHPFLDLTTLK